MSYDREEDILYLAHQLWEDDQARTLTSRDLWKEAALEILAQGGQSRRRAESRFESISQRSRVDGRLNSRFLKFRSSPDVYMGRLTSAKMVSLFKCCAREEASNSDMTATRQRRAKILKLPRTTSGC